MKKSMDLSHRHPFALFSSLFTLLHVFFSALFFTLFVPSCAANTKNTPDIFKPSKNTLHWLNYLDTLNSLDSLDSLEENKQPSQDNPSQPYSQSHTDSLSWLKKKTHSLQSISRLQLTEHFSLKPGKIKSKPLKLSDLNEYYLLDNIGENNNEGSATQKSYGLKFKFELN